MTNTPIEEIERQLRGHDVELIGGPGERPGAIGELKSVYVRASDDNLVEIGTSVPARADGVFPLTDWTRSRIASGHSDS